MLFLTKQLKTLHQQVFFGMIILSSGQGVIPDRRYLTEAFVISPRAKADVVRFHNRQYSLDERRPGFLRRLFWATQLRRNFFQFEKIGGIF